MEQFLANPAMPILIDVRGSTDVDPAIPGSHRVYILDIEERCAEFEQRFAAQMASRPLLFYCAKGEGSRYLVGKFSKKSQVRSLEGGMAAYLAVISRLLHEHPYRESSRREETMTQLLMALTDRNTPATTFRQIVDRLLRSSPNPQFRKLVS
ncbi:rhodanese-like domain-containing protein [Candidatus Magnetaquicoccus inordinatus]|uniref:rhodanese-like domain-containing protein n=1 Tax=Candidatus Magnetaquicoccus inordinatus TaxID=2496818 RepID=UPI00102C0A7A|nr:rhodanese-like domain-containing protein [Candidatus Magnetaquicoccus inordinatus]